MVTPKLTSSKYVRKKTRDKYHKFQSQVDSHDDLENILDHIIQYDTEGINNQDYLKIYKIAGQLLKPYLALEDELRDFDSMLKSQILSKSLKSSLLSYNPIKTLANIAELYRANRAMTIIARNLAISIAYLSQRPRMF